jgi:hypothetical protein
MNRKNPKTKANQADADSAKKTPPSQLHVSSRPFLDRNSTVSAPSTPGLESSPEPILAPSKHTVVVPVNATKEAEEQKQTTASDETPKRADDDSSKDDVAQASVTPSPEKTQVAPTEPPKTESESNSSTAPSDEPEDSAGTTRDKPNPETQKAIEEATEAAERQRKLREYTDSRQFFVPINAVAQKRSIKVSIGLTLLVLLLAILLIDLMLDSGTILLLQKIPHTHLFNLTSNP